MTRTLLKKEERMEQALNLMKDRGSITMTDYVEAGIGSRTSAYRDLSYLAEAFPEHVRRKRGKILRGKGVGSGSREPDLFIYKEDDRMENKYDNTKNESGANDPTAASAFNSTTGTTYELVPGDIWFYRKSNGCKEMHLILASSEDACTTCTVYGFADPSLNCTKDSVISISGFEESLYADVSEIYNKPNRYATSLVHTVDAVDLTEIRSAIGKRLNIPAVTETIIQTKYVEVEKPDDPNSITVDATDYALLCQKAALWEKAFYAVAAGKVAE